MAAKAVFSLSFDPQLLAQIDRLCKAQNLSRSQLMERWVREKVMGETQAVALMANPVVSELVVKTFGNPAFLEQLAKALGERLPENALPLFHEAVQGVARSAQIAAAGDKKPPAASRKGRHK